MARCKLQPARKFIFCSSRSATLATDEQNYTLLFRARSRLLTLASAASLGADVTQMESGKMARTATWGCCKAAHLYPYSYSCTLVMCLVLHWHCLCPAPCQPTQHHWHCILFAILHMTLRDIHTSPENWSRTFVYIYSYIHSPSWAAHYYYIWLCSERSKEAFWNIIYISDMPCRIISI